MLADLSSVDRTELAGRWYIQITNFPMWLTGTKRRPSLEYGLLDGDPRLSDTVTYVTARGARKQIAGYDAQDPGHGAHFTWRGKGLLALLSSDWYVVHLDAAAGVAAIYFTRTLFTPAGVDVIARAEEAPPPLSRRRSRAAPHPGVRRDGRHPPPRPPMSPRVH